MRGRVPDSRTDRQTDIIKPIADHTVCSMSMIDQLKPNMAQAEALQKDRSELHVQ